MLHLSLLGTPQVSLGSTPLVFPTRKALALLIYLVVEGGDQPRTKLMNLFWEDSDEKRGRGALRSTLVYLRRAFDTAQPQSSQHYLNISAKTMAFNPNMPYALDLPIKTAPLPKTVVSYRGPFLEGFALPDAPVFEEWMTFQREYWHTQFDIVFAQLTQKMTENHQYEAGLELAQRWLAHNPLNEQGYRALMHLQALLGNKSAALQTYLACQQTLTTELAIPPAPETETLVQRIRQDEITPPISLAPASPHFPFVGRETDFAQLIAAFRAHSHLILIQGEPGIGKTRLAEEFLLWAKWEGVDIWRGQAFEAGQRIPYLPVMEALRVRIEAENAPDDYLSDVWLAELSRLLPELRDRYPDLPLPTADEELVRPRLVEAIARLAVALTKPHRRPSQPIIWFADDLQWADSASLDCWLYCLHAWTEANAPVLLLGTYRPEALATEPHLVNWLAQVERMFRPPSLTLLPVDLPAVDQLVAMWQGKMPAFPRLTDWLMAETGGHPFYLTETLRWWVEQDNPTPQTGFLPPPVRQLILARLASLTPLVQKLLIAMAVLGRPCRFESLCQIANVEEEAALTGLDTLLGRGLVVEMIDRKYPYLLSHDKIRDVVYTEAGDAQRRLYHRRALTALEKNGVKAAELARHALAAYLEMPAFTYSLQAGNEALALFALNEAIAHYENAKKLLSRVDADFREKVLIQLSRAYELRGDLAQAIAIAREMYMGSLRHISKEFTALSRLGQLHIYTNQLAKASHYLGMALKLAKEQDQLQWQAEVEWHLAQLTQHLYQMPACKQHSLNALTLARQLKNDSLMASSLNNLGYAHLLLGEFEQAAAVLTEAQSRFQEMGNRALVADCQTALGGVAIFQGKSEQGIRLTEQALALYREIENPWGILFSSGWLAAGLLDTSEGTEALARLQRCTEFAEFLGATPVSIWHYLWLGNAHRALNQLNEALSAHRQAAILNEASPLPAFAWYIAAELCADSLLMDAEKTAYLHAQEVLKWRVYDALPQIILPQWAVTKALLLGGDSLLAKKDLHKNGALWEKLSRFKLGQAEATALLAQWEKEIGE